MALIQKTDFGGLQILEAYHRVSSVSIPRIPGKATIFLSTYINQEAAHTFKAAISVSEHEFDYDEAGHNVSTQGYDFLKTKPEFEGAQDA